MSREAGAHARPSPIAARTLDTRYFLQKRRNIEWGLIGLTCGANGAFLGTHDKVGSGSPLLESRGEEKFLPHRLYRPAAREPNQGQPFKAALRPRAQCRPCAPTCMEPMVGGGWEEREGKEGFRKNGKKERNKKNKKVKGAAEKKANEDR